MINETIKTYLTEGKVSLSKVIADCENAIRTAPTPKGNQLSDDAIARIVKATFKKHGHTLDDKDAITIANFLYEFE